MENLVSDSVVERIKGEALLKTALTSQRFLLKDGREIVIGREPDIRIYDGTGEILLAVEIKRGIDAKDVLERPDANLKNLSQVKRDNPNCTTILVVPSVAVKETLRKDTKVSNTVDHYFTKDELANKSLEQKKFFDLLGI